MTAEPGRALQMVCPDTLGPQPGNREQGRNCVPNCFLRFFLTFISCLSAALQAGILGLEEVRRNYC